VDKGIDCEYLAMLVVDVRESTLYSFPSVGCDEVGASSV
jgi:hypothetical protein